MTYESLMQRAIAMARRGVAARQSPFGAVVADATGNVVCEAHNTVRADTDATAHAEVNAIRQACRELGTIDLSGYVMITTCEPCPMCAAAIHWAKFDAVVFGATIADAARAGFQELSLDCKKIYQSGGSPVRVIDGTLQSECAQLFEEWLAGPNPDAY